MDFPFCAQVMNKYENPIKIGQGTFGEVFRANDKYNKSKIVALKKIIIKHESQGFPITALREIKVLQLLKHENIVNLIEICWSNVSDNFNKAAIKVDVDFFLVFEFCENDLYWLLSNKNITFSLGEIKNLLQQLLNGLYYIHSNKIIHRDLKASNVLITKKGT